jgi:[acyl-carrier-protein] S-malonyltransferase
MSGFAYLFPGQGSQKPGMGKVLYENDETAKEIFQTADSVFSDCSITSLCFEADEEELRKTENTQPALYTVSYTVYRVLVQSGYGGTIFAGHSLGEYTAVAAAGYISFEEGLRVVRQRGILMRDCDPARRGGMAAIIGSDADTISRVCEEIGDVYPANYNSPKQIVISGMKDKVQMAAEELKTLGAGRTIILNVGGPFHTPFMANAAKQLEMELGRISWRPGRGDIVSNVTAKSANNPDVIRENLVKQLYNPVLWSRSLGTMLEMGFRRYIESGPGTVLRGLFKAYSTDAEVFSVEKPEDIVTLKDQIH